MLLVFAHTRNFKIPRLYKTKLLQKLDEEGKVLVNLECKHLCQKYGLLPTEGNFNVFQKMPEFRKSLQLGTKIALTYSAAYFYIKNVRSDDISYSDK